jgi:hypothetical protein
LGITTRPKGYQGFQWPTPGLPLYLKGKKRGKPKYPDYLKMHQNLKSPKKPEKPKALKTRKSLKKT